MVARGPSLRGREEAGSAVPAEGSGRAPDPRWAWAPYEPGGERPWNLARAGHLYRRAVFGAAWGELEQAVEAGPGRSVERLLRPEADVASFNRVHDGYDETVSDSADGLRAWWLRRMLLTPHPLLEKMTLFWHDFFGTSNVTVKSGALMRGHLRLLRANALGSFDALLDGISKDPATLLALDAAANRKARPSVHFARNLMEHFTLGPGNFTETDAAEAARAFTGWFVLRGELRHFPREVDSGPKRILGEEGNFSREDVVRILLRQRATARLVVRRLYRAFVSETAEPSEEILSPLAESFDKDHDIGKLVEAILRSNLFFSEAAYRQRIKSPVDFALGIVKALEGSVPTAQLSRDLAALGMNLCHPPTVEGWPGGRSWISWSTIVGRSNLAKALLCDDEPYGKALDPAGVARKNGRGAPKSAAEFLVDLFLQGDLEDGVRQALLGSLGAGGDPQEPLRAFTHLLTALPEFHLA